jgi:DNA polymerase
MNTIGELQRESAKKIAEFGLSYDCLMDGDMHSEIAVIGEAPGEREASVKMPLVGGTGQLLWKVLRKYGLTRGNVYITNVVKQQLQLTASKRVVPASDFAKWEQLVHWELAQLPNVKYILLLGDYALRAILHEKGVTNWRGSVLNHVIRTPQLIEGQVTFTDRNYTVVCAYNPAYCLRNPALEPVLHLDLAKLNRVVKGSFTPHIINPIINPTPAESVLYCEKMIDEKKPIAFDIEVISNETACVGFANSTREGMCINFRELQSNRWNLRDESSVRRAIQHVLLHQDSRLVAQNGSFDSYYLWYKDKLRVRKIWFDTMLAHHTLYSTLPHGLGFLTTQYTNHPYYKDEGKNWKEGGNIDQFWNYNVKDCCITLACSNAIHNELKQQGLDKFFFEHIMRLQPHLVRMCVGGVKIDTTWKNQIADEMRIKVGQLLEKWNEEVKEITNDDSRVVNPNSPAQLSVLMFRDLRLHGKGVKTDVNNRAYIIDHPRTPEPAKELMRTLNEYKTENKFLTTYAEMRIDPDGRIRSEYKQTGVQSAPGRLSSSSVMWGSGTNLQNQPQRAYDMFIADDGYSFGYFDLSQAEARVVAWLAMITSWIEQFEKARIDGKFDCHRALASEMFDVDYEEVPTFDRDKDGIPSIRYIAKRCRHGLNYRMQSSKLAEVTGLSLRAAQNAYSIYHRQTPELERWWDSVIAEVKDTKQLFSPLGRRLYFLGRLDEKSMDSVIAFKPQSTIGDKVSSIIYLSEDDPKWPNDARICLNIHDALICLAPHAKVKSCLAIMKKHAEAPIMINDMTLIIPADCKISEPDAKGIERWSTLKTVEI